MSLLKTSLDSPVASAPFKVRMEPYLVESICELARLVRDKGVSNNDISGLLFGKAEAGVRVAEALKTFVDMGPHSELARRQRWEKAYRATADEAKNDPELAQLDVVGWFSFRTGSGLLSSDVIFHNQHFRKPDDVALIIWREGPSQVTVEVYSKSESDALTSDDYRWGSIRLSADIRHMREPVELAMRMKLTDDSYLRTYQNEEPVSHFEGLKRRAEAVSNRLFSFLNKGNQSVPLEDVKGLIGDGRLAGRSRPAIDAIESVASPQAYFNPYSDHIVGRAKSNGDAIKSPYGAPPNLPPTPGQPGWNGGGTGVGTAPARAPEFRPDPRFNESRPDPRLPNSHFADPRFPDQRYSDPRFPDPRFADPRFNDARLAEQRFAEARFADPRTAQDQMPAALAPQHADMPPGLDLMQIGRAPRTGRNPAAEISGLPMLLRPPAPPTRPSIWPWAIGILLLCSGLVFGFLALGGLQGENGKLAQIVESVFVGNALNLHVHNEDDRLRLSWNQHNRAVSSATDATLQIFDGPLSREIHLDGRQVADGSVLYRPQTNDVTFRLEVRGDAGSTSSSVRLVDGLGGRAPTLDVSSPAQNTAARTPYNVPSSREAGSPALLPDSLPSGNLNPATSTISPFNGSATNPGANAGPTNASAGVNPAGAGTVLVNDLPSASAPASRSVKNVARQPKPSAPTHYETPETIGTIAGGRKPAVDPLKQVLDPNSVTPGHETINGWDTVPVSKSRSRPAENFIAPRPLSQVTPDLREIPSGTLRARTRVAIQVGIDPTGKVISARPVTGGVNSQVLASALSAAHQWSFEPAQSNGKSIASQHTIVFDFPAH